MRPLPHLVVALLLTGPAWMAPATRVVGRIEGEFRDHLWVTWLVRERVWTDGAWPLTFPQAGFPDGIRLYPLDPLNQAAVTLLAPVVGQLPAVLLLTTALLVVAGLGAQALARALGAGPWAAVAAGVANQLGPPVLGAFADTQTEGMGSGWALWLGAVLVAPGEWTRRRALTLGLLGAALVASAPYQAHGATLLALPVALGLALAGRLPWRALGLAALLTLPVAGLALAGLLTAETHAAGQLTRRTRDTDGWPPRTQLRHAQVPPVLPQVSASSPLPARSWPREARYMPPTTGPRRWSGWVLPALVGLALLRRGPARLAAGGALLYGALALGSARDWGELTRVGEARVPLPFDLWYRHWPGGRYAWKPGQYAVPAWGLGVAAAAAGPAGALGLGLVVAEAWASGPTPPPLPAVTVTPLPVHLDLQDAEPGGVIDFPGRARGRMGPETLPFDTLVFQMVHRHPIGETFGRGTNPAHQSLVDALAGTLGWPGPPGPPLASAWARAARVGFRHLVIHGHALSEAERTRLDAAIGPLAESPRRYQDGVAWYRMAPE